MIISISLNPTCTSHMADSFTCRRCGRIVRAELYGEKNSLRYWGLKKLKLYPVCVMILAILSLRR